MALDLSSLKKAVTSLEAAVGIAISKQQMAGFNNNQKNVLRAGVIHNFEFTYELCWKFIQRWLKDNRAEVDVDLPRTRKDLFRAAAQAGLIGDPLPWFEYASARNLTSHVYDEDKAALVFEAALRFASEARDFLGRLEKVND